jgi:N,N-dimethylformamidase beta subunit-like protein
VTWYDHPVSRAETALTGVSYYEPRNAAPCYRVLDPDHWVFAGVDSEFFGVYVENEILNTVVGYEVDRYQSSRDPSEPRSPLSFHHLAEVPEVRASGQLTGRMACTMGIWSHGKGQVFTAATTNWSLGLSQGDDSWTEIDQITRNVMDRLG